MSSLDENKRNRRLRRQRKDLERLLNQGRTLVASDDCPGKPGIRETVGVKRKANGAVQVHVEFYLPNEWDQTLEQTEQEFPALEAALCWLETNYGVHWSQLHVPGDPAPN